MPINAREYNLNYKKVNKEKIKQDRVAYRELKKEHIKEVVRANKLRNRYGITPEDFDLMVKQQHGKCAICKQKEKLTIDHCHSSGKVRGLLCGNCNRGLGLFKDNLTAIKNAGRYIKKYGK